jgi:hypothetical protein
MEKPWLNLDPNNFDDRWWLYTSIFDTNASKREKNDSDIVCYFILQDHNIGGKFYRVSVWFKNDPNRYMYVKYDSDWIFDKKLNEMNEGDIISTYTCKFKAYNCRFALPFQINMCKILERIEQ